MSGRDVRVDPRRSGDFDGDIEVERTGGRRVSPGFIFLLLAIVGSIAYMAYTVTVRDASQIPLLASGAVVLAIVFAAGAAYTLRATLRAGTEDRGGRAVVLGLVGGLAAMIAAGFTAGAIILFQVASGPG
jgi:hypothetical protein